MYLKIYAKPCSNLFLQLRISNGQWTPRHLPSGYFCCVSISDYYNYVSSEHKTFGGFMGKKIIRILHRTSVCLLHNFRTSFPKNTSRWLLLEDGNRYSTTYSRVKFLCYYYKLHFFLFLISIRYCPILIVKPKASPKFSTNTQYQPKEIACS